jgi:hypothetical protein
MFFPQWLKILPETSGPMNWLLASFSFSNSFSHQYLLDAILSISGNDCVLWCQNGFLCGRSRTATRKPGQVDRIGITYHSINTGILQICHVSDLRAPCMDQKLVLPNSSTNNSWTVFKSAYQVVGSELCSTAFITNTAFNIHWRTYFIGSADSVNRL